MNEFDRDRTTHSGIFLPEPEPDKGSPIIQCVTDSAGLVFNIAGSEPEDVRRFAMRIFKAQESPEELTEPIEFVEPAYGQTCYLQPAGIHKITAVTRGFAKFIDHFAAAKQAQLERSLGIGKGPLSLS